jgi:stage V sporulation protein G
MEITEVRIKLMEESGERLQAFCSITFDNCFVIRDLKIIGGPNGSFVAMPSRRLTAHCSQCGGKNHLKAAFCNQCGARQKQEVGGRDDEGRAKLYADIAHPINQACRDMIQAKVVEAFHLEQERAKQPGYVSSYDDIDDEVSLPRKPHMQTRRDAPREPRREESHIRRVPPVTPTPEPPKAAEPSKREAAETQPPAPHTNLTPGNAPSSSPDKKTGFGEGIL